MTIFFGIFPDLAMQHISSTQISIFHSIFNVSVTILLFPFANALVKLSGIIIHEDVVEDEEEEEPEYDEHVWLSVKNAEVLSKAIADALEKVDPDHKDIYQENASAYSEKLKDLDSKYQEVVDGASQKTLLFGDRFPFRYLVDDYGLSYYAAFVG